MFERDDEKLERLAGQLPQWYRPVLERHDAETAFLIGSYHLLHHNEPHAALATWWFAAAAQDASADILWRIADEYGRRGDERQARPWIRRAIAAEYRDRPAGIAIDPQLFAVATDDDRHGQAFNVQVVSADNGRAMAALSAAARRFRRVTADGRELTDDEEYELALDSDDWDDYTPNYVSDPELTEAGPGVWCDCKGSTMPLMARAMLRIVVEEVYAAGLDVAEPRPIPA